jgi:hypothetical protein
MTFTDPCNHSITKKRYQKPVLEQIYLDTEISLVMASTQTLPGEPTGEPTIVGVFKVNRILRG